MTFQDYLAKTRSIAIEEKEVLDILRARPVDKITIRAAKSSLQTIIENSIGKAKKILQHYNCAIIPNESRDALQILADCQAIDDETAQTLFAAVGFRNAMIHDYMTFNNDILIEILTHQKYNAIIDFLMDTCEYSDLIQRRISNYSF
jgi:uncharacterized protein YutE (UPF0331/DUF86 family)